MTLAADATTFAPASVLLQRLHDEVPTGHFTLGWLKRFDLAQRERRRNTIIKKRLVVHEQAGAGPIGRPRKVKDDAMTKKNKSEARKKKSTPAGKQKAIRDISEMLDSIRLDWKELSEKPVATRHTRGVKKLLRWCKEELKALRKYYNETDG